MGLQGDSMSNSTHRYDKILATQVKEGRVCFGSELEDDVHLGREGTVTARKTVGHACPQLGGRERCLENLSQTCRRFISWVIPVYVILTVNTNGHTNAISRLWVLAINC